MRLRQVKISGFKSFADPTVIEFPSGFVGIVGPNGCGKSNVIDAVRWVMGETRAGELRATSSMLELIFAGSEGRAPAGRASVEMTLDNSDGTLTGPWGAYAEVAIRRTLTRDGQSAYFINNQPVRRRDVQDIFMGTGLMPHSYAIISQGMISSFVKAKPEELRFYFEEAAGVSRYKERRREAESRLASTRANLDRVADLQEVRKSDIERLSAEAELAGKWSALNNRKEMLAGVWLSLQERDAIAARDRIAAKIAEAVADIESGRAEKSALEKESVELSLSLTVAKQDEDAKRDALNRLNMELARTQSAIAAIVEKKKLLTDRVTRDSAKLSRAGEEASAAERRAEELTKEADSLSEEAESIAEDAAATDERAAEAKKYWESAKEASKRAADEERLAQKSLTEVNFREQALEQEKRELEARIGKLESEASGGTGTAGRESELEEAKITAEERASDLEEREAALEEARDAASEADEAAAAAAEEKASASATLSEATARLQALEEIQEKARAEGKLEVWAASHGLSRYEKILDGAEIETGWAKAVEAALSGRIPAYLTENLDFAGILAQDTPPGRFAIASREGFADAPADRTGTLAAKVRVSGASASVLNSWLSRFRTAESLDEAVQRSSDGDLPVITRDGHIAERGAVLFWAEENPLAGSLEREEEIRALKAEQSGASERYQAILAEVLETGKARDAATATLRSAEASLGRARRDYHSAALRAGELESEVGAWKKRAGQIRTDLEEAKKRLGEIDAEYEEAESLFEELDSRLASASQASQDAEMAEEAARNAMDEASRASRDAASRITLLRTNAAHALERAGDARQSALKLSSEEAELTASIEETRAMLEELDEDAERDGLQDVLAKQADSEAELQTAQKKTAELTEKLSEINRKKDSITESERPKQERIGEMKVKQGSTEAELQALTNQIAERRVDRAASLREAETGGWKTQGVRNEIGRIENNIEALGPVNHAALEHLEAAKKALEMTEHQVEDLNEAIATLEEAIRKIDAETRAVLKDTFDQVNSNFKDLFSRIFGGGEASLELIGDEILEAGIEIRAQPPGKRNASVKLLSGGEQALTATALVFAMFRLNPAPFCLLDEVDAPLDEANQLRLANMVQQMSSATQFIAITHNRITMEKAGQLIGVTMREPGVSRVVSVDLREAVNYAGGGEGAPA